jgi:uncharacterized hydrophobic protein (TIGR00341 family)
MALRLIELVLPERYKDEVAGFLEEYDLPDTWLENIDKKLTRFKILLPGEKTEKVLDFLEQRYSRVPEFKTLLFSVEAVVPRPKKQDPTPDAEGDTPAQKPPVRISREELYQDIKQTADLTRVFVFLVVLSSVVASIGILRDNVVFIIAAMVIAPLLGPNVALSLATTLGDQDLARKAVRTNAAGILTALVFSAVLGLLVQVNPGAPEIVSRTHVSLSDIVLALAAGSAAALSFTSGILSALIGVMVAVAILPPLVTLGLLCGAGLWSSAFGALILLLANLICINLAGVLTFLIQGIRPITWWESSRAKKATRKAIFIWTTLLLLLALIILFSP